MKKFTLILSAFLFLLFPPDFSAQTLQMETIRLPAGCVIHEGNILERRNCAVKWKGNPFSDALMDIFITPNVPSGISAAFEEADTDEVKINFTPLDFTVKGLLDEIVKFDTRYRWQETDGVVNVFPQNDYAILDVVIPEFKVEKAKPRELGEKLLQTKEFQHYLKARNLIDKVPDPENKYGLLIIGLAVSNKVRERHKVTLDLKNATVREILNAIVRQRGYSTWMYREYDVISGGEKYHLYSLQL